MLILGIMGVLTGFVMGMYHMKTRTFTPAYKDGIISDQEDTIKRLKLQIQGLNGKIGNIKSKQITEIEIDPTQDPKGSIMEIIDSVKDNIDPRFQKLLSNPKAMDFIVNIGMGLHKKHPKEIEAFVSQFLPSLPGIAKTLSNKEQTPTVSGL